VYAFSAPSPNVPRAAVTADRRRPAPVGGGDCLDRSRHAGEANAATLIP